jgi:hypothetical protein
MNAANAIRANANAPQNLGNNGSNNGLNNAGNISFFEQQFAQAAIDKANGDYMTMLDALCAMKNQIEGMGEYGNEGAARSTMEEEFSERLEELFGAAGGRRRRKHRKSRKASRKARKTKRR